jgi:hypothetical protein
MTRSVNTLIELKPSIDNHFICPECQSGNPDVQEIVMQSGYVLADCCCLNCGLSFYQTFPVGHTVDDLLSISKGAEKIYSQYNGSSWVSDNLAKSFHSKKDGDVSIERKIFKEHKNVVILNALDSLYGHVLLKLYNAEYHLTHQRHLGLIVIIPRGFEWLIPKGTAEAWIVNLELNELAVEHKGIQKFVSQQFGRFSKIYLSKAYSHPDYTKISIARLTGVRPFSLKYFDELRPTVTFVLREDRWWLPTVFDYWFYRACRKLGVLKSASRILSLRQNTLVKKTAKNIAKKIKGVDFAVVGLGSTGSFGNMILDERTAKVTSSVEVDWCRRYARSHVVVGVHGSNMLLPTALAAGCVEILPEDRYGNVVQDISVRYNDRKQLFFYRFVDQFARPRSVSAKVTSIINDFDSFNKNMCVNLYQM